MSSSAAAAKRVVFAAKEKGKTPNGDAPLSSGNEPRSILKTKQSKPEVAPPVVEAATKGKKRKAVQEDVVPVPSKKEKRVKKKAEAVVPPPAKPAKEKKAPAAAAPPTPVEKPVEMKTKSKAAERAKSNEEGYDFNKFFF